MSIMSNSQIDPTLASSSGGTTFAMAAGGISAVGAYGLAKSMGRPFGIMGALGVFSNVAFPLMTYDDNRQQGKGILYSAMAAGTEFVGWQIAAPLMAGKMAAEIIPTLAEAAYMIGKENQETVRQTYNRNFGGHYIDTAKAANQRYVGMQNISRSQAAVLAGQSRSYDSYNMRVSRVYSPQGDASRLPNGIGQEAKSYYRGT
jgi:hypothetical protein